MRLLPQGSNRTVVVLDNANILFSYETPVAAVIDASYYRTEKKWSQTTTNHINAWLDGVVCCNEVIEKPQSFFDNLIKDI